MSKYKKFKNKYNNLIQETLNSNKNILIDSFVEYYGEEYRNIIEKRYNEITFIYYVDWETIELVVEQFIPQVENPNEYLEFVNLFNCKETTETIFKKIFTKKKKKDNLPSNLIGTTNPLILNNENIRYRLFNIFESPSPVSFNLGSVYHIDRIISFQILSLSETVIIHEINHAITRDNLAYIIDDNQPTKAIHKTGLNVDISSQIGNEKNAEELINEKASREITEIFKKKGGDLSPFCKNIPLAYTYDQNLYLIDDFYDKFKKYIKIARISDNKNALIERIGKTNYENYINIINSYYTEDLLDEDYQDEDVKQEISAIINQMENNANASHDISKSELNNYYKYLENKGFKVRILNDIPDETSNLDNDIEDTIKRK